MLKTRRNKPAPRMGCTLKRGVQPLFLYQTTTKGELTMSKMMRTAEALDKKYVLDELNAIGNQLFSLVVYTVGNDDDEELDRVVNDMQNAQAWITTAIRTTQRKLSEVSGDEQ
jgi:hypothetical protein